MRMILFFALLLSLIAAPAKADKDKGLYDPRPPAGAAFVRFFNANEKPMNATIGGKSYGDIPAISASPYYVQKQGNVEFKTGLRILPMVLESGAFYTVVTDNAGNPYLHKDTVSTDPAKAMLVLYNLSSDAPLALKAQDDMVTVVENVEKGKSAYRGINGVKVDLSVTGKDGKIMHEFEPLVLERGRTYSIFFVRDNAVMAKGETDTKR